ncbi:VOC family protein [Plantactinospora siamensis]|uniref:VOC family protein n=1 Tax=Plantactinospora siamensis TaxID=555372 RepID=A0ABV6P5M9_9ACTN
MSPRQLTVAFHVEDAPTVARFWADTLGREMVDDGSGVHLPGDDRQVGLRFVPGSADGAGPALLHLHLTSASDDDQQRQVAAALRRGASHLDVGQRPEEGHIVLADPGGNAFCVIEPGNRFLAGCGPLGEAACDGSREVGHFWSAALDWPLVWDQDEETAIQSPRGGTKVAWGGPPETPREGRNRQWFELVAPADADHRAEVDRLLALAATRLGEDADGTVLLADPGGNSFRVRPPR